MNNNGRRATVSYLGRLKEVYLRFGDKDSVLTMDVCLALIKGDRFKSAVQVYKKEFKELLLANKKNKDVKRKKSGEKIDFKKRFNPTQSDHSDQAGAV